MQEQSHHNLESLAEQDPVSRPLARLQLKALRTAAEDVWESSAIELEAKSPEHEVPALHNQQIPVDVDAVGRLIDRLTDELTATEVVSSDQTMLALREIDPLALLKASIEWNEAIFEDLASQANVETPVAVTLGYCAALPLLLACGRRILPLDSDIPWEPGYCPVCANWPLIAEHRGLDKQQWLRCGRCSAAWRTRHQRCVYCDNTDYRQLGYMAPEDDRESRRAATCEVCKGYLKIFATVSPLPIADLLRQDLASLELDVAAMDQGYSRPGRPGFELEVELVPVETSAGSWLPWR